MDPSEALANPGGDVETEREADPVDFGRTVLSGLRSLFERVGPGPVTDSLEVRLGTGLEPPSEIVEDHPWVVLDRTFAFVDICSFTQLCERRGPHEALDLLTRFRAVTREVTARRGVRVAKWLGDGVMLVGAEPAPAVAAVAELVARLGAEGVDLHAGLAVGEALLFEGDDYVGRAVNIAARLGDRAAAGEFFAWGVDLAHLPPWVASYPAGAVELPGVGDLPDVLSLASDASTVQRLGGRTDLIRI